MKKEKEEFVCWQPVLGTVNCYHCGDSYQVTPCSMPMAIVIMKQFGKEHKKCKETQRGKDHLATVLIKVEEKMKNNPGHSDTLAFLNLKPNPTLGEKIAYHLEMDLLDKALRGEEIPEELKNDTKFMAKIAALRASGVKGIKSVEKKANP